MLNSNPQMFINSLMSLWFDKTPIFGEQMTSVALPKGHKKWVKITALQTSQWAKILKNCLIPNFTETLAQMKNSKKIFSPLCTILF